jgi:hypothetical protein
VDAETQETWPAGYFIAASIHEARRCTKPLQSRTVNIFLRKRRLITNTARYLAPAVQGKLI